MAGIRSADPEVRHRVADEVTDVHRGLGPDGVQTLASALIAARLAESDLRAQEAQLHATAEMAEWHEISAVVVSRLVRIDRPTGGYVWLRLREFDGVGVLA